MLYGLDRNSAIPLSEDHRLNISASQDLPTPYINATAPMTPAPSTAQPTESMLEPESSPVADASAALPVALPVAEASSP